jgi:hypothetical protein
MSGFVTGVHESNAQESVTRGHRASRRLVTGRGSGRGQGGQTYRTGMSWLWFVRIMRDPGLSNRLWPGATSALNP